MLISLIMRIFRYTEKDGLLFPDENGQIVVIVDNSIVKAYKGEKELESPKFWLDKEDKEIVDRILLLGKKIGKENLNLEYYLAHYPSERKVLLNSYLGKLFEDYVYDLLKDKYNVVRNKEIFVTGKLFHGHSKPDFIVENKLAIEAKVSRNNVKQTIEYSKYFKYGLIVFPFSGICKPPKFWACVYNIVIDPSRLFSAIDFYLIKEK